MHRLIKDVWLDFHAKKLLVQISPESEFSVLKQMITTSFLSKYFAVRKG